MAFINPLRDTPFLTIPAEGKQCFCFLFGVTPAMCCCVAALNRSYLKQCTEKKYCSHLKWVILRAVFDSSADTVILSLFLSACLGSDGFRRRRDLLLFPSARFVLGASSTQLTRRRRSSQRPQPRGRRTDGEDFGTVLLLPQKGRRRKRSPRARERPVKVGEERPFPRSLLFIPTAFGAGRRSSGAEEEEEDRERQQNDAAGEGKKRRETGRTTASASSSLVPPCSSVRLLRHCGEWRRKEPRERARPETPHSTLRRRPQRLEKLLLV